MTLHLGVDKDDTINVFVPHVIDYLNRAFGTSYRVEQFRSYDLRPLLGLPEDEIQDILEEFLHEEGHAILPRRDALDVLPELPYGKTLVTARHDGLADITKRWIADSFPSIFQDIVLTNGGRDHAVPKYEICLREGIDVIVDDRHKTAVECSRHLDVLLMRHPWNEDYDVPGNVYPVHDWYEAAEWLQRNEERLLEKSLML